MCRKTK